MELKSTFDMSHSPENGIDSDRWLNNVPQDVKNRLEKKTNTGRAAVWEMELQLFSENFALSSESKYLNYKTRVIINKIITSATGIKLYDIKSNELSFWNMEGNIGIEEREMH